MYPFVLASALSRRENCLYSAWSNSQFQVSFLLVPLCFSTVPSFPIPNAWSSELNNNNNKIYLYICIVLPSYYLFHCTGQPWNSGLRVWQPVVCDSKGEARCDPSAVGHIKAPGNRTDKNGVLIGFLSLHPLCHLSVHPNICWLV